MNRLQKKCLIATAGFHLLLIVILIVGPGFFTSKPKPDDTQLLDVIPANAIEAALQSGVQSAQPPPPAPTPPQPVQPPTPIVTPPTPVQPPPPAPQPVTPAPSLMERVEHIFKPTPDPTPVDPTPDDSPKPVEHKQAKPKPKHDIKVDLTKVVTRTAQTDTAAQQAQTEAKREAQREAAREAARTAAFQTAIRNLKNGLNTSTKVEMPGHSSVSYASYASIIKSIYTAAWTPPKDAANDEANIKVSITVDSNGNVLSSHIVDPSGDSGVDASVQRTLDRVTFIAPFPEGATEKTKNFIINFNLQSKRLLG